MCYSDVVVHGGVKLRQFRNKPVAIMVSDMSGTLTTLVISSISHITKYVANLDDTIE
jgi:hypothetical protein